MSLAELSWVQLPASNVGFYTSSTTRIVMTSLPYVWGGPRRLTVRNTFPGYGGGIEGYGKRYAANLADNVTGVLLSRGVYRSIFHQDPRYFYKGTGSIHSRLLYAISAAVIARDDDGRWKPNYSHVLGNFSAAGISNFYYPASDRGARLVLFNGLSATASTAFSNVLREFVFKRVTSHVPKDENGKP